MALKAVLFDLDGTLLDTAPDFATVLNQLRAEENQPVLDYQSIRDTVSNGASALVRLGFAIDDTHPDFSRLRERLLQLYSEHLADETQPFDGIDDLLQYVKQQKLCWGVVTNKPLIYTEPLLKKMPFPLAPATVVCPDHVAHKKPHPEPMLLACKQAHCKPFEAIYLGDHRRDVEAAHNAGMQTIACAYGYIEQGDNINTWQADHIIQQPREAIAILQRYQ
jgi:phosphoglycolate phosphatase